jgi:uncharacterized protein (DUF2336 family)
MDVGEFLQWMEAAPAGKRADAAAALARSYLLEDTGEDSRNAAEAALTVLLDDRAPEVRLAIAGALGASDRAPRHIIIALAADLTEIAEAVVGRSPLFADAELVDMVAAMPTPLQVAIAGRPAVSNAVAAAVAEVGDEAACAVLLANAGATIARISLHRIAERFGQDEEIRNALLVRPNLPPEVHQLLVHMVTEALGQLALVKAWMPEESVKAVTRDACDRATIAIAAETETIDLAALVEHLRVTGQLTTALLLRAVCAGNIAFFETALAVLSGVPEKRVTSLVRSGRAWGLRAVYTKAKLPPLAFEAFSAALDTWRRLAADGEITDRYRFTVQMVEAVLARYSGISDGEMNELATMVRRFAADQARDAARSYVRAVAAA